MMNVFKAMPLKYLLLYIYPNLYAVHNIDTRVSNLLIKNFYCFFVLLFVVFFNA